MNKMETILWYEEQLKRFDKIGLGNKSEFGTVITNRLVNATQRRLNNLRFLYREND